MYLHQSAFHVHSIETAAHIEKFGEPKFLSGEIVCKWG